MVIYSKSNTHLKRTNAVQLLYNINADW